MGKKKKPGVFFMLSSSKFSRLALGSRLVIPKISPSVSLDTAATDLGEVISPRASSEPFSSGFVAVEGPSSSNVENKSGDVVQADTRIPSAVAPAASPWLDAPKNLASRIKESAQL